MSKTVYLAGLISTDFKESLTWRLDAEMWLRAAGFDVLSPMRGKKNLASESPDGGLTSTRLTPRDIVLRDYDDIDRADIILVNLETFGSPRPMIGTMFEMGFAWKIRKIVIAVADLDNTTMYFHPFLMETVAHYFTTVERAVDFIIEQHGEEVVN